MSSFKKFTAEARDRKLDAVAFNVPNSSSSEILFISPSIIKEYLNKYDKVSRKVELIMNFKTGFSSSSSPRGYYQRVLFNEFFSHRNLLTLVPEMYGILKKKLSVIGDMVGTPKNGEYTSVNLDKVIEDFFCYTTDKLVFGNFEDENYEIDGVNIYHYVTHTFQLLASVFASPITILLFNIPLEYCLHPTLWYCKYREWRTVELAQKIFEDRKKDKRQRTMNVLDMMVNDDAK